MKGKDAMHGEKGLEDGIKVRARQEARRTVTAKYPGESWWWSEERDTDLAVLRRRPGST